MINYGGGMIFPDSWAYGPPDPPECPECPACGQPIDGEGYEAWDDALVCGDCMKQSREDMLR